MRWRFIDKNNRAKVVEWEIVIRKFETSWREPTTSADEITAVIKGTRLHKILAGDAVVGRLGPK